MNGSVNQSQRGLSYLFTLAAFVIVAFGIRASQDILQPLLLSFFIAVVCVPVYAWLVGRKIASWLALLLVIAGMLAVTLVVFWIVMTSLADFTSRQDHYAEQLRLRTKPLRDIVERLVPEQPAAGAEAVDKPAENLPKGDAAGADLPESEPTASGLMAEDLSKQAANDVPVADAGRPGNGDSGTANPNRKPVDEIRLIGERVEQQTSDNVAVGSGSAAGSPSAQRSSDPSSGVEGGVEGSREAPGGQDASLNSTDDVVRGVLGSDEEVSSDGAYADGGDVTKGDPLNSAFPAGHLFRGKPSVMAPKSRRSWKQLIMAQFDPGMALSLAATLASTVSQVLSNSLLIILTVVFILLEASSFPRKLTMAFGSENNPGAKYQTIVDSIRSYIVLKTGISIVTGILVAAWLWLFGVPYAGLWGMLAFLLNYIPKVGSIIAAIPALLVAWLDLGLSPCLGCAIGYAAINIAVGNLLEPRLLGRGLGLSPLVIFCSMLFWGWALGPVGMLLSVPLTMGVRVGLEGFEDTRWMGVLLGNADP